MAIKNYDYSCMHQWPLAVTVEEQERPQKSFWTVKLYKICGLESEDIIRSLKWIYYDGLPLQYFKDRHSTYGQSTPLDLPDLLLYQEG